MSEWHEGVAAIFDTLLAPRTEYRELLLDGVLLRAKVSIISIVRFNRLIRPESLDTTLWARFCQPVALGRSEEHTSELQSLMRISYAVFCLKKKRQITQQQTKYPQQIEKDNRPN